MRSHSRRAIARPRAGRALACARALALVPVLVLALSLPGCSSSVVKITETDAGKPVALSVGQTLEVTLLANPTTGFSWQVADASGGVLAAKGDPAYVQDPGPPLVGKGGAQTFTFDAAKAGSGRLLMEYRRPWETTATPERTFEAPIEVR
ncbi:MAG TPA: protease inhibitor I42 family protein [Coriobacteriia bacterium]